ncbi:MAG: hypothetical protein EP297_04345 [Gammaproteobacteria bacterium]|nr:MAG: hypothetical protein EP297_04345 [Gammaproteobacteria bacterium]
MSESVRPPWMAEVPVLQEAFTSRSIGNTSAVEDMDVRERAAHLWTSSLLRVYAPQSINAREIRPPRTVGVQILQEQKSARSS